MDRLAQAIAIYREDHRHPINKVLHYIGTPSVLISIIIFSSWIHLTMPNVFNISVSWFVTLALAIYYSQLDVKFAGVMMAVLIPCTALINLISGTWISYFIFGLLFMAGWILQAIGHLIENSKPSFLKKPQMLLIAPLYLISELAFSRGYRLDLQQQIILHNTEVLEP